MGGKRHLSLIKRQQLLISVFFDAPFLAPFNVEQITHCSIIVEATTFRGAALAPISPFFITFFDLISFSLHSKGARATRKGLPTWGSTIIFAKRVTTILFTSTFVNTGNLRKASFLWYFFIFWYFMKPTNSFPEKVRSGLKIMLPDPSQPRGRESDSLRFPT